MLRVLRYGVTHLIKGEIVFFCGMALRRANYEEFKQTLNKMFKKVHDKVISSNVQDTSCDPLTRLPIELAESILQYLTFQDIMYVFLHLPPLFLE